MPKPTKNKGGRPATGQVRPKKFMAQMSIYEREYLSRKTYALQQAGEDVSQNDLIIRRTFLPGWVQELANLRRAQRRVPKDLIWTPKQ